MSPRSVSVIQLVIVGFLWSIGGVFVKMIDLSPIVISSFRSLIAGLVLLAFLKFRPRFVFSKPQIVGAICFALTVTLFVAATKLTTAANAILLQYGSPIYVAFLGYFILREKLKWYDYVAIIGIVIGMIVFFSDSVSGGGGSMPLLGNILAVLCGVTFAIQAVCMRLHNNPDPNVYDSKIETILLGNFMAFAVGIPFFASSFPTVSDVAPLLILGIFQLGIPFILYPLASKHATALDLITLPMLEPLLNPVWVFLATGERPSSIAMFGGAIVLSMVVFKAYHTLKVHDAINSYSKE